jgi:tRNA A-37 threonylcarbamoyl transferase component Bud32
MRNRGARGLFACSVTALAVALGGPARAADPAPAPPAAEPAPEIVELEPVPAPAPPRPAVIPAPAPARPPVPPREEPVRLTLPPKKKPPAVVPVEVAPADVAPAEAAPEPEPTAPAEAPAETETAVAPEPDAAPSEPETEASAEAALAADAAPAGASMTLEQAADRIEAEQAPEPPAEAAPAGEALPSTHLLAFLRALDDGYKRFQAFTSGAISDLQDQRLTQRAQILCGVVAALFVSLFGLLIRMARGRGEIQVALSYPQELKGTFSVRLSQRKSGQRGSRVKGPEDAARLGASTRTEHHMVARETSFRGLLPGTWYVLAEGFVQKGESEVISTHCDELEAQVARRQVSRLDFDFQPRACPLEVKVTWDRRPVEGALVARRGAPGSMRMARGAVQLSLDLGRHVIIAGNADRVAEVAYVVETFQPRQLVIDLASRESLLFTGCPHAVAPYLNGDVPAAARALERDGQHALANTILARFHLENDRRELAAKHFEAAGEKREAAELYQALCSFEKAATLFEQSGDDERAAENYRSAGKLLRAGDAYSRADAYDSAVECFRRAGDVPRWIDALEKQGDFYGAAKVAFDQGERQRGLQCLHKVLSTDPNYAEAVARLIEAHAVDGTLEIGLHKVDELIGTGRDALLSTERIDSLARLLEESGAPERALGLLERLRERDNTWPGVATRVETLRKRRSRDVALQSAPMDSNLSVFSSEFRYEILEEVGRGGMGIVFKARDRRLGRVVALKRLPDNLRNHPKAVELFLREARAAAALNHPNIVTLFDAGQEGDTYYITMELLEGQPLQKILRERKRLSAAQVAKLGGQVATGLQYAHEQGIVHRDIKTANLFFTSSKLVKIMDFGLAKMVEEVRRSTTVIGGTPYYMAPEQGAGDAVDHRADLYALGVTFFELLTGTVPFREGDVTFHHRHTPAPDARTIVPEIPASMAELVLHLMAKRPEERVASATAVRQRLAEIARGAS